MVRLGFLVAGEGGHHLDHLARVAVHAADVGASSIVVFGRSGIEKSTSWRQHITPLPIGVEFRGLSSDPGSMSPRAMRAIIKECARDGRTLVALSADNYGYALLVAAVWSRFSGDRVEAIAQVMRPPELETAGVSSCIAKSIWTLLLRYAGGVKPVFLTSALWSLSFPAVKLTSWKVATTHCDPLDAEIAPSAVGVKDVVVLAAIGALDDRKHISELVEAAPVLRTQNVELKIAGVPRSVQATAALAAARGYGLAVSEGYLDEAELIEIVSSADFVWCVTRQDLPSGLALRALSLGTRIVARAGTRLAAAGCSLGMAVAVDPSTDGWPIDLSLALHGVVASSDSRLSGYIDVRTTTPGQFSRDLLKPVFGS